MLTLWPMFWMPQLTARLDLVHNHPRFAPPSSLADNTQVFSPEKAASLAPHVQDLDSILSTSDEFLSRHSMKDGTADFSFDARVRVLEEAVECLHNPQEVPVLFGETGDIKISVKKNKDLEEFSIHNKWQLVMMVNIPVCQQSS